MESSFELNSATYASCADEKSMSEKLSNFQDFIRGFVDISIYIYLFDPVMLATSFCWEELSSSGAFHCSGTSEGKFQHPSCHIGKAADHSQHSFTHVSGKL